MKAYICDRCERTYLKNNKVPTSGRIHGSYIAGFTLRSISGDFDAQVDLCDDCIEDLMKFMEKPPVMRGE